MVGTPLTFEIREFASRVEAWSDVRLPFQARAQEVRRFREELRAAIARLPRSRALRAAYQSADASPCDVENVALYNVGSAPFRNLGGDALVVERPRGFSPISPSGAPLAHYLGYEASVGTPSWSAWTPHRKLIEWRSAPIEGQLTATSVWASLKRGEVVVHRPWNGERALGVVVRADRAPVAAVKAMVDGVVSAGHFIEGPDVAVLGSIVSMPLRIRPQIATSWLTDRTSGVLGPRRLVLPRAGTFQWNPADDRVAALTVERRPGSTIEAEVWTLAPVVPD